MKPRRTPVSILLLLLLLLLLTLEASKDVGAAEANTAVEREASQTHAQGAPIRPVVQSHPTRRQIKKLRYEGTEFLSMKRKSESQIGDRFFARAERQADIAASVEAVEIANQQRS